MKSKLYLCAAICINMSIAKAQTIDSAPATNDGEHLCETGALNDNGRLTLTIDGQKTFPMFFVTSAINGALTNITDARDAGYPVTFIPIQASASQRNINKPIWTGIKKYNWGALDEKIWQAMDGTSDMKIGLYLSLEPPQEWIKTYADELNLYEDKTPSEHDNASIFGNKGPSLASQKYLEDVENFLNELINHIQSSPYGNRIFGIHFVGGHDGQWMHRGAKQRKLGDYSKPMLEYFRNFLRGKYGGDAPLLQKAWQDSTVTFETATIPTASERIGKGDFRDPSTDQRVIDYTEAYGQAPVDLIKKIAHVIKKASAGKMWASTYTGSSIMDVDNSAQIYGRFLQYELLQCPDLDGLAGVTYNQRPLTEPGAPALANASFRLHGKLAIQEQDIRTYLATIPHDRTEARHGFTPDWEQQSSMLKREFGQVLSSGIGSWQYDMHGGWYNAPEFWQLFTKFQKIGKESLSKNSESIAEVAVIVDDYSQIYRPIDDKLLMYNSITMQKTPLGWMGAPYDVYLLEDLVSGSVPKYKCYFFLNTYSVDSKQRKNIHERLKNDEATAVWLYAPGIICDDVLSLENIRDLTGFSAKRVINESPNVIISDTDSVITKGMEGEKYGTPETALSYPRPAFEGRVFYSPVQTPEISVLGLLEGSNIPGLAMRKMDGWTSIYSSGLVFTPDLLKNILTYAGCHLYSLDPKININASSNYISIYSKNKGLHAISFPQSVTVKDVFSNEEYGPGKILKIPFDEKSAKTFSILKDEN